MNKTVGTVTISRVVSERDVEDIMVGAIEGAIGYWCNGLENDPRDKKKLREDKPKDTPLAIWVAKILCEGRSVGFNDGEDIIYLDLQALLRGIQRNITEYLTDPDNYDAEDYDRIIQLALYEEVLFG